MTTLEHLLKQYGPLMTLEQLAGILNRSADSLRVSSYRPGPLSAQMNAARRKIGRRVYYQTTRIAELIDDDVNS